MAKIDALSFGQLVEWRGRRGIPPTVEICAQSESISRKRQSSATSSFSWSRSATSRWGRRSIRTGRLRSRIGPDLRMAVAGFPAYFAHYAKPRMPKDLTNHNCINLRTPTHRGVYVWEFEKNRREVNVRIDVQHQHDNSGSRPRRPCPDLSHRGTATPTVRSADPRPRRSVSTIFRLPPLLPEPSRTRRCIHASGRCTRYRGSQADKPVSK